MVINFTNGHANSGGFLTWWFQNMPGRNNAAVVDDQPMKNWWPFMYY